MRCMYQLLRLKCGRRKWYFVTFSVDDIDVLSKPNVPMRIIGVGAVAWMPGK